MTATCLDVKMSSVWDVKTRVPVPVVFMEGNPLDFWLQLANVDGISRLQANLQSFLGKKGGDVFRLKKAPNVGDVVGVRWSEDNQFYRAIIKDVVVPSQTFIVRFIDYGNVDVGETEDLYVLPADLQHIPAQAVHCKLKGLTGQSVEASPACRKHFEALFQVGRGVNAIFHVDNEKADTSDPDYLVDVVVGVDVTSYVQTFRLFEMTEDPLILHVEEQEEVKEVVEEEVLQQVVKEEEPDVVIVQQEERCPSPVPLMVQEQSRKKVQEWLAYRSDTSGHDDHSKKKNCTTSSSKSQPPLVKIEPVVKKEPEEEEDKTTFDSFTYEEDKKQVVVEKEEEEEEVYVEELKTIRPVPDASGMIGFLVEHIESPCLFYVHLASKEYANVDPGRMFELETTMKKYFEGEKKKNKKCGRDLTVGNHVAAWVDDGWMRGIILKRSPKAGFFEIRLVDYGDIVHVHFDNVRRLPLQFGEVPRFALPVKLMGIGSEWSPNANDYIREATSKDISYFIYDDSAAMTLPLEIIVLHKESTINQDLIALKLASPEGNEQSAVNVQKKSPPSDTKLGSWNPMASDYMSPSNRPHFEPGNVEMATENYKSGDDRRLCKFYRATKKCSRGNNCKFLHIFTGDSYHTKDEEVTFTVAFNEIQLPEIGSDVLVEVPVVRHPGSFYCIMPRGPLDRKRLTDTPSREEMQQANLASLNEDMTKYYGKLTRPDHRSPPCPGEVVAVRFQDERWYRGRIVDTDDQEETEDEGVVGLQNIRVFFVDFGHMANVDQLAIRKIEKKFLHLPFQAFECTLANVSPNDNEGPGKWSKKAAKKLREMTTQPYLIVRIRSTYETRVSVDLYANVRGQAVNVGQELVYCGLAVTAPDVQPAPTGGVITVPG